MNKRKRNLTSQAIRGEISPGGPEILREVNARRALSLLRQHGPCSRADLVRYSGLSAPTISSGVEYLQEMGLVEPLGAGLSTGGRPPQMIRFNSKLGYVMGVNIGTALVRAALADLDGTVTEEWVAPTNSRSSPERVSALASDCVRNLVKQHRISERKILALVAGVPGITNVHSGTVVSAPTLSSEWRDVPLQRMLERETGIRAAIENDVNLAAIGESWCGTARGVKNFVFLTVGTGVGAGIFVDGRLHHGSGWAAGEIGYLFVPGTDEAPPAIYRPGSLEDIIGARGIERSWQKLCDQDREGIMPSPRKMSATEVFDAAGKGESCAVEILNRTARILADAITNVCVILDASLVVLGGRVGSHPALFAAARQIVDRNEFCRPRLALSALGSEATLQGAIWLALRVAETKFLPSTNDPSLAFQMPIGDLPVPPQKQIDSRG